MDKEMKVHYSSNTHMWETPDDLFDELNKEFHFDLDVCAIEGNTKCERYFSPEEDGLKQEWSGNCWMNPPYGREIPKWMKKAYESNTLVVCLVPSRTDTAWWHDYAMKGSVRFIRGRVKFKGGNSSAPFPSAIIIFRPKTKEDETDEND